jgi:tRNA 2-thiouridine synthesizing protein A
LKEAVFKIWHDFCLNINSVGTSWQEETMYSQDLECLRAVKVIDARWAPCPGPLLEAKEGIGHLESGEVIEVQAVDPGARGDISAWAAKVGDEFLGFLHSEDYDRIFVRKSTL